MGKRGSSVNTATTSPVKGRAAGDPHFVYDPSFERPEAASVYGGEPPPGDFASQHMPDEVTRDCVRRMHYAAWRATEARSAREAARWWERYYECRDLTVLGNRKLVFRAVSKWGAARAFADDLAGECQVVLIRAVAAYNPWLGIRFSTYAFTCLMRALSRLTQRLAADRLARAMPLDDLPDGGEEDDSPSGAGRLDKYLREEDPLLTPREKAILIRRFGLDDAAPESVTLAQVARALGLSKERVRQVQLSALGKLRQAMLVGAAVS